MRSWTVGLAVAMSACGGGGNTGGAGVALLDQAFVVSGVLGQHPTGFATSAEIFGPQFVVPRSGTLSVCFDVQWTQSLRRATPVELGVTMVAPVSGPGASKKLSGVAGANQFSLSRCVEYPASMGSESTRLRAQLWVDCGSSCPEALAEYSATIRWTATLH